MLDLIDAVERLKKGIVEGGVSLGHVEQAVGKVASGIDVYLILAVSRLPACLSDDTAVDTRRRWPSRSVVSFCFFAKSLNNWGRERRPRELGGWGRGGWGGRVNVSATVFGEMFPCNQDDEKLRCLLL